MPTADPLSIIVINDFASVAGGIDKVALTEAAALAARGHQVTLIAGRGEPDPDLGRAGVAVHTTGQHTTIGDPNRARSAARGVWNRASESLVRDVVSRSPPEQTVVHIHGFTKILSASVVRAAVRSGLPTVATLHDFFAACPNGAFFNFQTSESCPLRPLSARCLATHCDARSYSHKLWRAGRTAVQSHWGAMPSGVRDFIAPSRLAGEVLRPFLPSTSRLHVVGNPIPGARLPAADPSRNGAFLFVGRLSRDKGPTVFAQAARAANVPAVFVGDGDQAQAVCTADPGAELKGWLHPDEVGPIMREARAVVNSSLWHETQGLSTLEAAAHGVPAIVSDATVLREVVADGETGLWFRGGDVGDLAEKLAVLDRDPLLAGRLGSAAYERFWAGGWDVDTHVDRLESIYRTAASR